MKNKNQLYVLRSKTLNLGDNSVNKVNQKVFLVIFSALDGLSNDTTHNPLQWIYRSAKNDRTGKPFEYIFSSSPTKVGRNKEELFLQFWVQACTLFEVVGFIKFRNLWTAPVIWVASDINLKVPRCFLGLQDRKTSSQMSKRQYCKYRKSSDA